MPLRKKFPDLKDLCVDNITRNIVVHGERFKRYREHEEISDLYRFIQSRFSNDLVKKLFAIYKNEDVYEDTSFKEFIRYFFQDKIPGSPDHWPCLELLFNEYTTHALPSMRGIQKDFSIPLAIYSYIAAHCKNLRCLNQDSYDLIILMVSDPLLRFQNLQSAELGRNCDSEFLERILGTCPLITKLSADLGCTSDAFLFSLCKYCSKEKKFVFCKEKGACSQAAKHLRYLRIEMSGSTGDGIACALQHLPQLRDFGELPAKTGSSDQFPDVVKGILTLKNAAARNGRFPIILNLTDIFFTEKLYPTQLRKVTSSCPKLQSVQLDLSLFDSKVFTISAFQAVKGLHLYHPTNESLTSEAFKQFLATRGKQIKSLSFISSEQLDLRNVNNILNMCNNLQQLTFWENGTYFENYSDVQHLPSCIENVEKIILSVRNYFLPSCNEYFSKLLGMAKSVKFLDICLPKAEKELTHAVQMNDFNSLEEISLEMVDGSQMPLEKLVDSENNLRKIHFYHSRNLEPCVELYKDIARNKNYEIEIERVCDLEWI